MLVVVGHPKALCCDENWDQLIRYCMKQRTYMGDNANDATRTVEDTSPEDVGTVAELSLLGPGDLDLMFPDDIDDIYDSVSRVML